jgi:phosphoglycerol transferase MdoB-like AlkP superfamily enzyme
MELSIKLKALARILRKEGYETEAISPTVFWETYIKKAL